MACILNEETQTIAANIIMGGTLSGLGDSDTYQYTMIEVETVTFRIVLSSTLSFNATLKLYSIVGDELILIGVSNLRHPINIFEHASVVGDYFFCIESVYPTDYTVELTYTDYRGIVFVDCVGYSGEVTEEFTLPEDEVDGCKATVLYKIVKGSLPPGLEMSTTGLIYGVPEEQDWSSKEYESPSFTWHRTQENGETSYTKVYPFKLRAWLYEYPAAYVDKDFTICVYNNWTLDNIPFMASVDNFEQLIYECKEV